MALEVGGKSFETDEEGYLANLNDWNPDLANAMACLLYTSDAADE